MLITAGGTIAAIISLPKHIDWKPMANITTHQLARLMPVLLALNLSKDSYANQILVESLPEDLRRHFAIRDPS